MIIEDYCSFEVAKLLKEKGFYGECLSMYVTPKSYWEIGNSNEFKIAPHGRDSHFYEGYLYQCEAPTLQMACKWLREVHNTCICINMVGNGDDSYVLFTYNIYQNKNYKLIFGSDIPKYNSYEEAVEAAIKYTLENLI